MFIAVCKLSPGTLTLPWNIPASGGGRVGAPTRTVPGKLPLFSNVDANGRWRTRFRTFLIDSSQLESGEALSDDFRKVAAREIEEFKKEKQARGESIEDITDADLLREVMNTIGRPGRLGADIRCVVSVSMLTEGWDAGKYGRWAFLELTDIPYDIEDRLRGFVRAPAMA